LTAPKNLLLATLLVPTAAEGSSGAVERPEPAFWIFSKHRYY